MKQYLLIVVVAAAGSLQPALVHARKVGTSVPECAGCHEDGLDAKVTLIADKTAPNPGDRVRLTVKVERAEASAGGFFLFTNEKGNLELVTGQGTRFEENGVTHTMPKAKVGGAVTFTVDWVAPATAMSSVDIRASGVGANLDDTPHKDGVGTAFLSLAVGCAGGKKYFEDFDQDGLGFADGAFTQACSQPTGFAEKTGDCNDNDDTVAPGKDEICDGKDNDCDGETDEGFPDVDLWQDFDGDGHGRADGQTRKGCGVIPGWGTDDKDCNDSNKNVHPGAMEICNMVDDDCDGNTDENALPTCGEGACRRRAPSCDDLEACVPGKPSRETCNLIDDDCDGETDEAGESCPGGGRCEQFKCVGGDGETGQGGAGGRASDDETGGDRRGRGCAFAPGRGGRAAWPIAVAALVVCAGARRRRWS